MVLIHHLSMNISKSAKIVQVDIDPIALGRYFPIELGINNDAKKFLENLSSLISHKINHNNSVWVNNFYSEKEIL